MYRLTYPQEQVLRVLLAAGDKAMSARDVAAAAWPHDPGWRRRTHRHDGHSGAVGGQLPLRAGRLLATLQRRHLAANVDTNARAGLWRITPYGSGQLAAVTAQRRVQR